ncbi:MAG TPA: flavin reductase family protein [Clostridia bacterium]|nr:flavin reductase family protein [Clostridia bacterium]HOL60603.1 flavin reductase family protein [Clostridia bacterium]HPO53010.1 flavin reductase family protein [Clostridia bacterium]
MMFKETDIKKLPYNPFTLIGDEWMLICAGNEEKHNFMTAGWGGLGVLWNKNVATVYIRPTRYTLGFVESEPYFALCFFGKDKKVHKVGGNMSGRDVDKTKAAGLTPVFADGTVYFEEAEMVFICKKIYHSVLDNANFLDPETEGFYENDYHKIFVGEIVKALIKPGREI